MGLAKSAGHKKATAADAVAFLAGIGGEITPAPTPPCFYAKFPFVV